MLFSSWQVPIRSMCNIGMPWSGWRSSRSFFRKSKSSFQRRCRANIICLFGWFSSILLKRLPGRLQSPFSPLCVLFTQILGGYNPPVEEPGKSLPMPAQPHILDRPAILTPPPAATSPMLQEVFNLDEGPVTLSFPSALTEESYEELKAQLELFLRRAQRRARQRLGEKVIREVLKSKKDEAAN